MVPQGRHRVQGQAKLAAIRRIRRAVSDVTPTPWLEPCLDGLGLGLFMVSALGCGTLLELPGSPVREAVPDPFARRALMGLCMALTAVALIHAPSGKRSGAHLNPATTLTFWRLGRLPTRLALRYVLCQFAFGALGLLLMGALLGGRAAAPEVNFVATLPGPWGHGWAFLAELGMTFALMSVVLPLSQSRRWNRWTGVVAGLLVGLYITFEAPVSGMSLNPARTFASALLAADWTAFWLYCTAPLLGMLLAAEVFARRHGLAAIRCAKLHHGNPQPCPFRCRWGPH